ncbi:TadE/TadG family type IV pilus assembly protein [Granulicella tundricola]|uniref:TadE family protein n=1 Tax=Granulicella tundricola (strain ATCC BAA-1859 / DSM 23138 / MP5ACTX9) TaxID=1198114 RepID=E8WYB9_GRATM|nr:TadE/TadG family type IV pilus assembly protein [Granulicella tundricola]ADW69825.1 TadE family protein [Granulicella tundricola MP5ACTX9]
MQSKNPDSTSLQSSKQAPTPNHAPHVARLSDESGSALVDFSLSIILFLLVVFGIMDCSRALFVDHFIAVSARQATRYAMVRGSSWNGIACSSKPYACTATSADIAAYVMTLVPMGVDPSRLVVNVTWPGTMSSGTQCTGGGAAVNQSGCIVVVNVSYPFSFVLPFMPRSAWAFGSRSSMTIAY